MFPPHGPNPISIFRTNFSQRQWSEFVNHLTQKLFHELEIVYQKKIPYTSQQNGQVERKHRHLLDMARSIRFQASIRIKYW